MRRHLPQLGKRSILLQILQNNIPPHKKYLKALQLIFNGVFFTSFIIKDSIKRRKTIADKDTISFGLYFEIEFKRIKNFLSNAITTKIARQQRCQYPKNLKEYFSIFSITWRQ